MTRTALTLRRADDAAHPAARDTCDPRYRRLVGDTAWATLPEAVRRRFSKRLAPGDITLYRGAVVETRLTPAGRALAALARLVGAPLPLVDAAVGPAVVSVSEDASLGGQCWTRTYARAGRFPQVISSAKRFRGPTGLEEYIGYGIGMSLTVAAENGALVFRSQQYFFEAGAVRIGVPRLLSPGLMEIVHRQGSDQHFTFTLTLTHPRFGLLLRQIAVFRDVV